MLDTLGLEEDVTYRLSKWDSKNKEKYLGDDDYWNRTQEALREVLRENGVDVTVDNRAETKAIRKEVKAEEETK